MTRDSNPPCECVIVCNLLFEIEIFFTTTFPRITQYISLWSIMCVIIYFSYWTLLARYKKRGRCARGIFHRGGDDLPCLVLWTFRDRMQCCYTQGRGGLFFWNVTRDSLFIPESPDRVSKEELTASPRVAPHITPLISSAPVWFSLLLFHYYLRVLTVYQTVKRCHKNSCTVMSCF